MPDTALQAHPAAHMKIRANVVSKSTSSVEISLQHLGHLTLTDVGDDVLSRLTPGASIEVEVSAPEADSLPELATKPTSEMNAEELAMHMGSTPHETAKSIVLDQDQDPKRPIGNIDAAATKVEESGESKSSRRHGGENESA